MSGMIRFPGFHQKCVLTGGKIRVGCQPLLRVRIGPAPVISVEPIAEAQPLLRTQQNRLIGNLHAVAARIEIQVSGQSSGPAIDRDRVDIQIGDEWMLQFIGANAPQPLTGGKPGFAGRGKRAGRLRSAIKLRRLAALIGAKDSQGKKLFFSAACASSSPRFNSITPEGPLNQKWPCLSSRME